MRLLVIFQSVIFVHFGAEIHDRVVIRVLYREVFEELVFPGVG